MELHNYKKRFNSCANTKPLNEKNLFPYHLFTFKKVAFTLAEVLITLSIIGIVSALTVPHVVSNYRRIVTQNKLKQTYSIFQNVLVQEDGRIPFSVYYASSYSLYDDCVDGVGLYECAVVLFDNFFRNKITNIKEYKYNNWEDYIKDASTCSANSMLIHGKWFTLPNGCTIGIYNGALFVITDELKKSRKIKIVGGKNLFVFLNTGIISYDKLSDIAPGMLPLTKSQRAMFTHDDLIESCKTGEPLSYLVNSLSACSQLFIEDGLRFSKDYPIKF